MTYILLSIELSVRNCYQFGKSLFLVGYVTAIGGHLQQPTSLDLKSSINSYDETTFDQTIATKKFFVFSLWSSLASLKHIHEAQIGEFWHYETSQGNFFSILASKKTMRSNLRLIKNCFEKLNPGTCLQLA